VSNAAARSQTSTIKCHQTVLDLPTQINDADAPNAVGR